MTFKNKLLVGLALSGTLLGGYAGLAQPSAAAERQPVKTLSQVLENLRAQGDFKTLEGVDFDADDGVYYEIAYIARDGERMEIKINAVTGLVKRVEVKSRPGMGPTAPTVY